MLDHVKARHECMHGMIESAWRRDGRKLTLEIAIPANTEATVHVPASAEAPVYVDGSPVTESGLVEVRSREAAETVLHVPSGSYTFTATLPEQE